MPKKQVLDDKVGLAAGNGPYGAQEQQNNFHHVESIDIPRSTPRLDFRTSSGGEHGEVPGGW
jgi:hypothetical protein